MPCFECQETLSITLLELVKQESQQQHHISHPLSLLVPRSFYELQKKIDLLFPSS